jgi:hypothetical protein
VALFQSQPEGLGLFLRPSVLYEIHPCISPLRGQQSCSNEFQTHLSITYVERLHAVLSALPDTKIVASSGGYERSTNPRPKPSHLYSANGKSFLLYEVID